MSDGHYRQECEHGQVISQCRCAVLMPGDARRLEIVRPCPFWDKHRGMVIKHPLPPAAAVGTGLGQVAQEPASVDAGEPETPGQVSQVPPSGYSSAEGDLSGSFKQCVFRSCGWTIPEPDSLLGMVGLEEDIRVHLRTHRVEIELLAQTIEERG